MVEVQQLQNYYFVMLPEQRSLTESATGVQRRWNDCHDQILGLKNIGENWDGDGACAPSPTIIDRILALIQSDAGRGIFQTPPDAVNPLRDGTIALEWTSADAGHVIIRFDDPVRAEVITISPDKPTSSFWEYFSNVA